MVKQTNSKIVREIDKLNENETLAVLEYISAILSSRHFPVPTAAAATAAGVTASENQAHDDLIASLSEKRVNRCARQVVEWEKVRRRAVTSSGGGGNYQQRAA